MYTVKHTNYVHAFSHNTAFTGAYYRALRTINFMNFTKL